MDLFVVVEYKESHTTGIVPKSWIFKCGSEVSVCTFFVSLYITLFKYNISIILYVAYVLLLLHKYCECY